MDKLKLILVVKYLDLTQQKQLHRILSHSDYVAGIPYEEILLDPVKNDKAIKDKILLDYSLDGNKVKLPPLFTPSGIDGSNCEKKGEFKITTNDSIEIESKLQFNIPVTYPEEFMTECSANAGAVSELKCIIGNKLESKHLLFEQQILRNGLIELFTLGSYESSDMNCTGNKAVFDELKTDKITDKSSDSFEITDSSKASDATNSDKLSDKTSDDDLILDKSSYTASDKLSELTSDEKSDSNKLSDKTTEESLEGSDNPIEESVKSVEGSDKPVEVSDVSAEGSDKPVDESDKPQTDQINQLQD